MARRERTTALPRHHARSRGPSGRRFLGINWDERATRIGLIGLGALLGILVLGIFGYQVYQNRVALPSSTVATVGSEDIKLRYYTDRLGSFVQQNSQSGSTVQLLERALLTKLEDEELTLLMAADRGITISDDDVKQHIATQLGVSAGGDNTPYDTLYRERLKSLNMSNGNYLKLARAEVADTKVREAIRTEVGDTAELITLRGVVVASEEKAKEVQTRATGGEDLGSIAQLESTDLASRQQDGLMAANPSELLPEEVRKALEGKTDGELLGPVQVGDNWWVFKVERRDAAGTLTDEHKTSIVDARFTAALKQKRASTSIDESLDTDELKWAEDNVN